MVRGCFGWTARPKTRLSAHKPVRTCRQLSPPSGLTQAPVPIVPAQMVKLSAMASSRIRLFRLCFPPRMRNVDYHTVGAGPFHLEIAMATGGHLHIKSRLLLKPLALRALQFCCRFIEVFDLEAEVMDAAVVRSIGPDIGGILCLPIQDRQIDVTVGQKYGAVRGSADLFQSKSFLVERCHFSGLLCGQRDVLNSRHRLPPCLR